MQRDMTPETRRIIIQFAAKENVSYQDALEWLVMEGIKAVQHAIYSDQNNCA